MVSCVSRRPTMSGLGVRVNESEWSLQPAAMPAAAIKSAAAAAANGLRKSIDVLSSCYGDAVGVGAGGAAPPLAGAGTGAGADDPGSGTMCGVIVMIRFVS